MCSCFVTEFEARPCSGTGHPKCHSVLELFADNYCGHRGQRCPPAHGPKHQVLCTSTTFCACDCLQRQSVRQSCVDALTLYKLWLAQCTHTKFGPRTTPIKQYSMLIRPGSKASFCILNCSAGGSASTKQAPQNSL